MIKVNDIIKDADTGIKYIAVPEKEERKCIGCSFREPNMKKMCFQNNKCRGIIYIPFIFKVEDKDNGNP